MIKLYNKLEHLENLILAMNQNDMKRIRLPIPSEYGGGYVTGDTLEAAVQKVIERVEGLRVSNSPYFFDYYNEWIELKSNEGLSVVTIEGYKSVAEKHLIPFFGKKKIGEITPDDIQRYFNSIMHFSKSYSVQSRAILSSIFDRAARNKLIRDNPMQYRYKSSNKQGEKVVLQDEDLISIIKNISKLDVERDYLYVCFLCFTAMRREEILGLRWGDIDFEGRHILIQNAVKFPNGHNDPVVGTPKDNSVGVQLLPNLLEEKIRPFQGYDEDYIFCYDEEHKDRPITRSMFVKMWNRIKTKIDLKGATSHSFRASYASMITAHCNADPKTLQQLLRHKTPDLAMRVYAKHNDRKICTTEQAYETYISTCLAKQDCTDSEQIANA